MEPLLWSLYAQSGGEQLGVNGIIDKVARVPISKVLLFALVLTAVRVALYFYLKNQPIHLRTGLYSFLKFVNDISDAIVYAGIVVFMLVRPFGIQTFFIPSQSMVDTLRIGDYIVANKFIYRTSDPRPGDIVVFKPPADAIRDGLEDVDFIKRCAGAPGDVIEFDRYTMYRNGKAIEEPYKVLTDPSPTNGAINNTIPFSKEEAQKVGEEWDFSMINFPPKFKFINYEMPDGSKRVVPLLYEDRPNRNPYAFIYMSSNREKMSFDGTDATELIDREAAAIPDGMYMMVGDNRNGSDDSRFWGLVTRDQIIGKAEFTWLPFNRAKNLKNHEDYFKP